MDDCSLVLKQKTLYGLLSNESMEGLVSPIEVLVNLTVTKMNTFHVLGIDVWQAAKADRGGSRNARGKEHPP